MGAGGSKEDLDKETGDADLSFLEALSDGDRTKVEGYFTQKNSEKEELKSQYERFRIDSEQKYFEIEKQLIASNKKLEAEAQALASLKVHSANLEKNYNESVQKSREVQEELLEKNKLVGEYERQTNQLDLEKDDLAQALGRKDIEIEKLTEEWKQISQRVNEANSSKFEALARMDEVLSKSTSAQHQSTRLTSEKQQLETQIRWLEDQLKEKTDELQTFRRDKSGRLLELQSQLEEKESEVHHLEAMTASLRETVDSQNMKIENYCTKLKDANDMQIQIEEQYRNELQSKEKLVNIYKTSDTENASRVDELTTAVRELQKLLKTATEATKEVERLRTEDQVRFEEDAKTRDEVIDKLRRELHDANDLIEAARKKGHLGLSSESIEALSPSAAATSRLLKSGMTLTQIYSEYVKVSEDLLLEKEENSKLNQYMDQILRDIEEKAPVIKKQREDYEMSINTIDGLTKQLDAAMSECEELRDTCDERTRRSREVSRENERLKTQTADLAQQVRMLLKELEEARGTVVTNYPDDAQSRDVTSSGAVISDKLVTFRSIEELHEQNQRLLGLVRELSDKQEEEERSAIDSKTAELRQQLEATLEELEEMKAARERQTSMVESVVRQRDMYRVLLQQTGSQPPIPSSPTPQISSTPAPPTPKTPPAQKTLDTSMMDETKAALKELQAEFTLYRKEKGETEKMLSGQVDTFRQDASEVKVQNARLASQLDYAGERYKILQSNVDGYKKEISALQDKNQKFSASVIKHEQVIQTLREEVMSTKEKLTRAEVRCENLRAERDMLKEMENRLVHEKEAMIRENRSLNMLKANLQAIQNNLERAEFETKTKLSNRIEQLEGENTTLRRRVANLEGQNKGFMMTSEKQVKELKTKWGSENEAHNATRAKLLEKDQLIQELKDELSKTEAQFAAAELRLSNVSQIQKESHPVPAQPPVHDTEEIKDLKSKIEEQNAEIKALKEQLELSKRNVEQYKDIADSIEKSLKEQNEASQDFKQTLEAQIKEAKAARERLEVQVESLEKERQTILEENIRLSEGSHTQTSTLRQQLATLQKELESAVSERETAIASEIAAKEDWSNQAKLAQESQDKYERELILHAADVEALTKVKQQLEEMTNKLQTAEEGAQDAKHTLEINKNSWTEKEALYKKSNDDLHKRIGELQDQNKLLLTELESLSEQMMSLQRNKEQEDQATSAIAESVAKGDAERSSEQLLEVIHFLRKEKDIIEAKFDVINAESQRNKQLLEHARKQTEELSKNLNEERETAQIRVQTAAQHADLLRKVENMNILHDSNKLLREEKDRLLLQFNQLEAKCKKLEEQLNPLQESIRDLTAQRDSIRAEKVSMQGEVERWKARTNHLIEQCNKTDPEELKKAQSDLEESKKKILSLAEESSKHRAERDEVKKQLTQLQEECARCRATISRTNTELTAAKNEAATSKTAITNVNQELEKLKKDVTAKNEEIEKQKADVEDKGKTIAQLRRIGRKYRVQAEELQKQIETLNQESSQKVQEASNTADLENKLSAAESELAKMTESLGAAEAEKNNLVKRAKDAEAKVTEIEGKVQSLTQELEAAKEKEKTLNTEKEELEKKQVHFKNVLGNAKTKMTQQKDVIEKHEATNQKLQTDYSKLQTECSDLKQRAINQQQISGESDQRLKAIKSQLGSQITDLQKKLDEAREENAQLQQKIQQLQKQLSDVSSKPTVSATPVERPSVGAGDNQPRTANIRPMATPSAPVTQQRKGAPVQPVRSTTETRAMASIRPMAVPVSTTPTATVMPTTVSVPQEEMVAPVRPTQSVQPVSPVQQQVDEVPPAQILDTPEEYDSSMPQQSGSTQAVDPVPQEPSTSHGKRSLAQMEDEQIEDVPSKKSKTQTVAPDTEAPQVEETEAPEQWDQQAQEVIDDDDEQEADIQEQQEQNEGVEMEEPQGEDTGSDVIVVGEEDEEEIIDDYEGEDGESEEQEQEFGDDYEDEEIQEDMEGYDDEDEPQDGDEEEPVVIDDDDDDDVTEQTPAPVVAQQSSSSGPSPPQASSGGASVQRPADRALPVPARSQLPPFNLGEGSGFEGDDGIVPSTPTLYVPKRSDGFAEAVSSPQVQRTFTFGGSSQEGALQQEGGQLASQAADMDDTRIDLSQLEEGSSAPSRTPPSISVIEPSPPNVEGSQEQAPVIVEPGQSVGFTLLDTEEEDSQQQQQDTEQGDSSQPQSMEEGQDRPGTSVDDGSEGPKPKIQRIIWDDPAPVQETPSTSQQQQQPTGGSIPVIGQPVGQAIPTQTKGKTMARGRGKAPAGFRGRHMQHRGVSPQRGAMYPRGGGHQGQPIMTTQQRGGMQMQRGGMRGSMRGNRPKRGGPYQY